MLYALQGRRVGALRAVNTALHFESSQFQGRYLAGAFAERWLKVRSWRRTAVAGVLVVVDVGFKVAAARNLAKSMLTEAR